MVASPFGEIVLAGSPVPSWLVDFGRQIEHVLAPARDVIKPILSS